MSIVDSIPSKNVPMSGRSATITTEREFLMHGIDRVWRGLTAANQRKSLDFMRALTLAGQLDPERTAALTTGFQPKTKADVDRVYRELLQISADAITDKLNQQAANDD